MTQEEINDLLERPQPTCASMLDMPMEAELSSALATARAEADRVAALVEQLADVVRVLERIDEAAKAGKEAK